MLERQLRGAVPHKPHSEFRGARGELLWEECITQRGFEGPFTIAYHEQRPHEARATKPALCFALPTPATALAPSAAELAVAGAPETLAKARGHTPLERRHYPSGLLEAGGCAREARTPLLFNADLVISSVRPTRSDSVNFINGDADELYFIHEGSGVLWSAYGALAFQQGDYVGVPRGLMTRFELSAGAEQRWLLLEVRGGLDVPAQYRNGWGQLRMDAPYCHRDFRVPEFRGPIDAPLQAVLLRGGELHGLVYERSPFDWVGWDGCVYPWAFSIHDFSPRVGRFHLPPTVHGTFAGAGVLICSFVPRPLDFDPRAIPCPYPHSSVDIDEVIFYSRGQFGSRRGVGPGSISHHPAGIPHGPHPGAYEASVGKTHTDELAVMLDCARPLQRTAAAQAIEDLAYHASFRA